MQIKKKSQVHKITLVFPGSITRTVSVKAASREVAEHRALKFNPGALCVAKQN